MIYSRPSYADLYARIAADLVAMPVALREPLAASWGRVAHGVHGHLDWVVAQTSPLTCELERLYDWAELYGVPRLDATAATGSLTVSGTPGAQLLTGSLVRSTAGLDYQTLAAVTVGSGGTVAVDVRCTTTGAATNLGAGQTLTLTSAQAGVSSSLLCGGLTGGADAEAVDDWRARVADEWRTLTTQGARGGRPADYVFWAKSAHPSVTGAIVQLHNFGLGTVTVRPVCNALSDRLPTAAVLAAVEAYLVATAPLCDVRVLAPTVVPLAVTLDLAAGTDTASNRASVETALSALAHGKAAGAATITPAEIDFYVSSVTSGYTRIAPLANVVCTADGIFVLQPVTWV